MTEIACRLVRVHGHVQDVGFREACMHAARRSGVTGWIRNRIDGSVEAMLQGAPDALEAFTGWLRDGDSPGLVERIEVEPLEPPFPRFDRFDRLATA